ncbi:MAG: FAD-dependent monooxygenase [Paraglaciecola sp.]|uniref:FAD-dependent monooxygenase n=1 Tax=Paraglaciecola sp. TaxID=1920173 RepID=UPI003299A18D
MGTKIVIAGAGIGGLCAALAMSKKGCDVAVYEQSAELSEVGAGLQLSPNAMHVLAGLNVADEIKALGFQPSAAVMRHYQTGAHYFSVPLGAQATQKYGADYLHIHRADLQSTLYKACLKENVSVHLSCGVVSYQLSEKGVSVELQNSTQVQADLLVGADGIKSKVQSCMLGQTPAVFTGQVAWRGTVEAYKLPKNLVKPKANLWVGPGQHFVSYYLRGGDLVNFVAVQERVDWQQEAWNEPGDINELKDAFKGWHPEVTEVLDATESCFLWALFDRKPLNQWVDKQVALLGDACHPMLPFLAQGAAMAIEDSYVLAHYLGSDLPIPTALKKYQDLRLARTKGIQLGARKNAGLYHMSSPTNQAKLAVLSGLSKFGLSDAMAANKLDDIYGYNLPKELG